MDVTLLLNRSAAVADCKDASRESTPSYAVGGLSTAPSTALPTPSPDRSFPPRETEGRQSRGRTPWNAGGYSLPLHDFQLRSKSISYRSASEQFDSEATQQMAMATERHSRNGSSDSDVMPSGSMMSSMRPQPSRAVSSDSHHQLCSVVMILTQSQNESIGGAFRSASTQILGQLQQPFVIWILAVQIPLEDFFGDYQSKVAEHDESRWHNHGDEDGNLPAMAIRPSPSGNETSHQERPGSPSDAILMKGPARALQRLDVPRPPFSRSTHLFSSPKLHKRAISAPDFASATARFPRHPYAILPPPIQGMPSAVGSPLGARGAPSFGERREVRELSNLREMEPASCDHTPASSRATPCGMSSTPEYMSQAEYDNANGMKGEEEEPRCMFVANCDTGSQLRKAISHLFGRNKSCTLKIPKEVWVYYCRKHYQRIRYRNARTYPSNQMDLVKVQIRRLQAWSEGNKAKGRGPYIKQWTLSLRKREQNRLENGKGAGGEGEDDLLGSQSGSVVPDWLIQLVGDGYSTEKMLEIAERLHKDIVDSVLSQVPEIEFLPDIVDDEDGGAPKPRTRRQNSSNGGKTPKRKASDFGVMSRQNSVSGERPSPEQRVEDDEELGGLGSPSGKRVRIDRVTGAPFLGSSDLSPASGGRPMYNQPSPAYNGWGSSLPPRAPNVVPKMRPIEYGQSSRGHWEPEHRGQSPYAGVRQLSISEQSPSAFFSNEPRLTLPSISAQMSGGARPPHPPRGSRSGPNGFRASHQRSASAFVPTTRPISSSARPSSSGNSGPPAPSRIGNAATMYDMGAQQAHGPPGGHFASQPYQEPAWTTNFGSEMAPQPSSYQQSGMYPPAQCQDMVSPRSNSPYNSFGNSPAHEESNGST
ncbi:hypothetical protein HIM_02250 [Hirsutella minnesotensis 3608]|nr:hypothetical protein HIM_02250 [Hirsutella minnesotensis 3608]